MFKNMLLKLVSLKITFWEIFKNYPSTLEIFIEKTKILAKTKRNGFDYFRVSIERVNKTMAPNVVKCI